MIVLVARCANSKGERVPGTRERIVSAASTLFMTQGYSGSGLKQISDVSAATIGSLYHFFPGGKVELTAETLREAGRRYQALVETIFDASPDLVAGIRNCFDGAAATLRATDYADACPIATVALEVASSNEPLRIVTAEIFESWRSAFASRFAVAGVDPTAARELADVVVAALEGGFLLCRAAKDAAPLESIGRAMVDLVEAAIGR